MERGEFEKAQVATLAVDDAMKVLVNLAKKHGKEAASLTPLAIRYGENLVSVTGIRTEVIANQNVVVLEAEVAEEMNGL